MAKVVAPGVAFFAAAIVGWAWIAALATRLADPSPVPIGTAMTSRA
jgi:hypothetical protein